MNKNLLVYILSLVLVIGAWVYTLTSNKELECPTVDNTTVNQIIDNTRTYNCSFTKTYNVVNTLEDYETEVPELSYIIVDGFQDNNPVSHVLSKSLKDTLEANKSYEFTYTLEGTGIIEDMNDVYSYLLSSLSSSSTGIANNINVSLTINETDKVGIEQINESICG